MHYPSLKETRAVSLNFSQGCVPGSVHVYGCPVMDDLGARWRKTPSNWWRVRCLFQHKRSPWEQAFSILSTGHGVERVNGAALIDQSGFSRWIQFWIILSSMVNLSLLSKYMWDLQYWDVQRVRCCEYKCTTSGLCKLHGVVVIFVIYVY